MICCSGIKSVLRLHLLCLILAFTENKSEEIKALLLSVACLEVGSQIEQGSLNKKEVVIHIYLF